jgi:hypothetical protein
MNPRLIALIAGFLLCVTPRGQAEWDFSSLLARTCSFDRLYEPPGHRANMASSYDRQLMNADASGFIREENGRFLMADIQGPGAVVRLWSANPEGKIWVYLDDAKKPLIEADFRDLFLGKVPPFVEPFVCVQRREEINCYHWAYVPIPFSKSCRIYLDKVGFFQATYVQFPPNTKVETLTLPLAQRHREALERLAPQFAAVGATPSGVQGDRRKLEGSIQPGRTARLATLKGPAVIRAFRLKWPELDPQTGRTALLTLTWDGEATPSVRVPLADFFGSGFKTLLLGVGEDQTGYCYFPMPFQKSAEISVVNEGKEPLKVSGELVVEQSVELPLPLRTFHAMWRRDLETRPAPTHDLKYINSPVCDPQYNYLVADIKGLGHYVATMLHRDGRSEGDEYVFVDGEPPPGSSPGTGNEDYFNMAWGPKTMDGPLAGGSEVKGIDGCLRVHLPDAIAFEKSLRFTFEVLCGNDARYDYDTTAYWYQEEPHAPFPALLPAPARRFRTLPLPPDPAYVYTPDTKAEGWWNGQPVLPPEGEDLRIVRFEGPRPEPVDMLVEGPDWSGGKQLLQRAAGLGASFAVKLPPVDSDGWHKLTLRWTTGPEYGRVRLRSNAPNDLHGVDCYAPMRGAKVVLAGAVQRMRGDEAELTVEVVGKDKAAAFAWVGIDWLMLEPTARSITNIQMKPTALPEAKWQPCPKLPPPTPEQTAEAKRRDRELPPTVALEPAAAAGREQEYLFQTGVRVPADGLYRLDFRVGWPPITPVPASITVNGKEIAMDPRRFAVPALPMEEPLRFYLPLKAGDNELRWRALMEPKQWIAPLLMGAAPPAQGESGAEGIDGRIPRDDAP